MITFSFTHVFNDFQAMLVVESGIEIPCEFSLLTVENEYKLGKLFSPQ